MPSACSTRAICGGPGSLLGSVSGRCFSASSASSLLSVRCYRCDGKRTDTMLTVEQKAAADRLESVFFAQAKSRRDKLVQDNLRLVHYTTAENAINIIRSKAFWMRDTRSMTDFREVEHGYSMLLEYFTQKSGKRDAFYAALDQYYADAGRDALKRFDDWWAHIRTTTYICCFSEHSTEEDSHGRLSMWRAYGPRAAV